MKKWFFLAFTFIFSICFADFIIVSDRAGFTDPDEMSNTQEIKQIDFTTLETLSSISDYEWHSRLQGKKVAILVHGYNNDFYEALNYFQKLIAHIGDSYDECICYLWPGGDQFWEYFEARSDVMDTNLPQRFGTLIRSIPTASIDIIAHSMGCRLSLEALILPNTRPIKNLFLMAPAVDDGSLNQGENYHPAIAKTKDIYVFYSEEDEVMDWIYPLAELDEGLGADGPELPNHLPPSVKLINCSNQIDGHSEYASSDYVTSIINNASESASVR